jgi:hypothetical protein
MCVCVCMYVCMYVYVCVQRRIAVHVLATLNVVLLCSSPPLSYSDPYYLTLLLSYSDPSYLTLLPPFPHTLPFLILVLPLSLSSSLAGRRRGIYLDQVV